MRAPAKGCRDARRRAYRRSIASGTSMRCRSTPSRYSCSSRASTPLDLSRRMRGWRGPQARLHRHDRIVRTGQRRDSLREQGRLDFASDLCGEPGHSQVPPILRGGAVLAKKGGLTISQSHGQGLPVSPLSRKTEYKVVIHGIDTPAGGTATAFARHFTFTTGVNP